MSARTAGVSATGEAAEFAGTVVVFGGTSYVAHNTITALLDLGYRIIAVSRRPSIATILLQDLVDRIELVAPDDVPARLGDDVRAVINFAYVRYNTVRHQLYRQTRQLMQSVYDTARRVPGARVIHISTQSVFGYHFQGPPRPEPVAWTPGEDYIESKIYAEHFLLDAHKRAPFSLAIVRLGNVIGPGSPPFVADMAQRMIEGRPVGWVGKLGPSNCTYVDNIASYLTFLVGIPAEEIEDFGLFHHVAEFGHHGWSEVLERIAGAISRPVRLVEYSTPSREGNSLASAKRLIRGSLTKIYRGPFGRFALSMTGRMPEVQLLDRLVLQLKRPEGLEPPPAGIGYDRWLLDNLANPYQFTPHTVPSWQPPISFDEAMGAIGEWVRDAGYLIEETAAESATTQALSSQTAPR